MSFFERNKGRIILICATVFLIITMALSTVDSLKPNIVSNAVNVIISPIQSVISGGMNSAKNFFSFMFHMEDYQKENEELKKQVALLEKEIRETEELKKENSRLRSMLDMKSRTVEYTTEAAEVIAKDSGNWFNSFTVDKGTADGVELYDPVITYDGLVGYVSEAGSTYSRVTAIIDSTSSVAATVKRTADSAVVEGDLKLQEQGKCRMVYVDKSSVITVGDDLETSGLGGIYPKGIYLGRVLEAESDSTELSQQAIIETAVDFDSLSVVFIITDVK